MMSRPTPRFTRSTIMYKLKPQNMIMNYIVIILYSSRARARARTHARTHTHTHTHTQILYQTDAHSQKAIMSENRHTFSSEGHAILNKL